MSSLDSWLMSDLEVWVTLAAVASVALIFVPALGAPAWAEHRGKPKLIIVAFLVAAALGGLAWYAAPASSNAASFVAVADRG